MFKSPSYMFLCSSFYVQESNLLSLRVQDKLYVSMFYFLLMKLCFSLCLIIDEVFMLRSYDPKFFWDLTILVTILRFTIFIYPNDL
jgi:hypothetical protein